MARVEIVEKADVTRDTNQEDQKMKNQAWKKFWLVSGMNKILELCQVIYLVIEFAIFCIWYLVLIRDENMSVTAVLQKLV